MEWFYIFVLGFSISPKAFTVIVKGPKTAAYPEGTNVTLQCIANYVRNRVVWEDIKEKTVIFIDKTKNTQREKFDNFFISDVEGNFSLTIVNVQLSDDGFYSCKEGDESRNAIVTIEAGPDLSVFVNNTLLVPENVITLTEDDQVIVMCKAEGAKPAVYLTLKFGENEWIETNNITTSEDGLRFTTEASVTHPVSRHDTTITCNATGQISIPPSSVEISINVLHKPVCHVELNRSIAECKCVSNPQVSGYKWYVNGTFQGTELLLPIHDHMSANLMCLATNAVGTGALAVRYVSSTNVDGVTATNYAIVIIVIAAVIVCGIIVCSLIFYCLYKRRREKLRFYDSLDVMMEPQGRLSSVQSNDDGEYKDAEGEQMELGGGQPLLSNDGGEGKDSEGGKLKPGGSKPSVKSNDDGKDKDVQCDNSEPEERASSEDSEDDEKCMDPSWTPFISQIAAVISHDWEIFAIEDLNLKKETVKKIIRQYSEVSDQLSAALKHWVPSFSVETISHLEKNILRTSEVYNYYIAHPSPYPSEGENNAVSSTNKTFSELVAEVGKCVGHIGAHRLSRQYQYLIIDTFTDSQINITFTGEYSINLLQEKHLLTDDMESLRRFKNALDDCLLLRASNLVDTYINEKGMFKKRLGIAP